jgi:hypothetical protein
MREPDELLADSAAWVPGHRCTASETTIERAVRTEGRQTSSEYPALRTVRIGSPAAECPSALRSLPI